MIIPDKVLGKKNQVSAMPTVLQKEVLNIWSFIKRKTQLKYDNLWGYNYE